MSLTADRVTAALGPGIVELAGEVFPPWLEALVAELEAARYLLEPLPDRPGTPLSDLESTPYPGWFGQVVGVHTPAGTPAEQTRAALRARKTSTRGRPAAIIAAVKATLTGPSQVLLMERYDGRAYQVRVVTYTAQTPDPAATLRAALSEKPVGIVLTLVVANGQSYAATTAEGKTYAQHTATGRSYAQRSMVTGA